MLLQKNPWPLLGCPYPGPDLCFSQITHTGPWPSRLYLPLNYLSWIIFLAASLSVSPQLTAGNVTNESWWVTDLIPLACLSHEAQPWISRQTPIYRAQHSYLYSQLLGTMVSLRQCTTAFICLLNKYLLSIYSVPVNILSSENATVNGKENVPEFMFKGKEIRW